MTISASRLAPPLQLPANADAQQPSAQPQAAAPAQPLATSPEPSEQAKGDSELAGLFAQTLRTAASTGKLNDITNIPPASSFGQWWSHLHKVMQNPDFASWAKSQGIDLRKSTEINHGDGSITPIVGGQRKRFSGVDNDYKWNSMMAPIMQAAKALTSQYSYVYFTPSNARTATYQDVADFYGEPDFHQAIKGNRAAELEHSKTFDRAKPEAKRSETALNDQKARLGAAHDRVRAYNVLSGLFRGAENAYNTGMIERSSLGARYESRLNAQRDQYIRDRAPGLIIPLHPDSPRRLKGEETVTLGKYLHDNQLDLPTNRDELLQLGRFLDMHPLLQTARGDYGGALSWPVPLSDDDRQRMKNALSQNTLGISDLQNYDARKGVFDYLTSGQQYSTYERENPHLLMEKLLATPKAQALGQALQEQFNAPSTPQSIDDWTLGALGASLDEGSEAGTTSSPIRTGVAGFDLARPEHWGKHPSTVTRGLASHLVANGRASAEMAPVAAHLLLSRKAPAFLVKGIPDKVTYGSHTWVTFSVAVARLEARAPGSTSRMSFSEVMKLADVAPLTPQDRQVEKMAQRDALKDWGVANGVLLVNTQDDYTADQMSVVFMKFNAQIRELSEASSALSAPVPTRREMAIEVLKRVYGHDAPVEDELIYVNPPKADYPGPYSLVDLYMKGYLHKKPEDVFGWWSGDDRVKPKTNTYGLPNINDQFDTAIQKYFLATEKGIAAQVKNLIATLPLEDRKNIEQGKITPLSETTYIRYTRALHAPLRSTTTKKPMYCL
ncbi:hypothetical protein [Pseudomonas sp. PAMC 26793]|uniref:hypothetical protein n=1 Tax=Pseudomonas sp. PAMC 26793 TaxID=1240676 RepID=UPI0003017F8C|nr:hypothetical protein [Pseudomonas sp. PAMC 26793]